jgi:hypothetical protein
MDNRAPGVNPGADKGNNNNRGNPPRDDNRRLGHCRNNNDDTGAATTVVITTGTTVVKNNNTVTNEIAMMAITISIMTSTTATCVLTLNSKLRTVRPMKPVIA